jgi:ParB family chromosome partitioning protein
VETAVRAAALDALGRMARHLKDPEERQRVVDRVEREARESHDDAIRLGAAKGLGQIGGELAKVRLQAMAGEDSSDEWRVAAIEWLGKLGDPSSEKVLAEALSHWDDDVREPARKALERIFPNDRERVELLCALSSESETSEPAIQWLVEKGSPAALLAKLPEIEDDDVREQIRYGLVRRGALPVPELSKLLLHEKAEMRFEAASLIGAGLSQPSAPAEAREPLAKALVAAERVSAEKWRAAATDDREEEAKAWQRIVWACGVARATQFVPAASAILSGAAGGSPAEVRREAVRVLSLVGSIRDAAVVQTALADLDGGVRSAATEALIRLAPKLIPALAQHGGAFDPIAFGVQPGALTAQGFAGSEDSWRLMLSTLIGKKDVAALIGAAQQGDARRRAEAMRGLGEVGSPEAIEFLESQAGEGVGDEPSRKAAYRALRRAKRQGAKAQQRA